MAWFIRGTTLYRRQLLVRPDLNDPFAGTTTPQIVQPPYAGGFAFYGHNDLSVRAAGGAFDLSPTPPNFWIAANSLGDLSNRENRLFHRPMVVIHLGPFHTCPDKSTLRMAARCARLGNLLQSDAVRLPIRTAWQHNDDGPAGAAHAE